MTAQASIPYSQERSRPDELDRWLALGGVLGPVVFVVIFTVAGLLRPGYSAMNQAISDLGVGPNAWLVNGSLVILGATLVAFAISFYRSVRRDAGVALRVLCAVLLASVGIGFAVAGIFDETNPLHWLLGASLVYGGAALGFPVAGLLLRGNAAWRAWGNFSLAACLVTIVLIAATFYTFSTYTYSPGSPGTVAAQGQLAGLMERVLFIAILAWYVAFGWRLFRAPRTAS